MSEPEAELPAVLERAINPLIEKLKRRIPGETYRVPSRGLFYTSGELDSEVENGEVLVYPMTTVDELKMRHIDMLFQGTAVTDVIGRCVPQILKPGKLIASDIDFLLTCIRKVSYGPLLPIKHNCTKCDAEHEYNLAIEQFIHNSKEITQKDYDNLSVVVADYAVKLKPCTFEELVTILQRADDAFDTPEKISAYMDNSLLHVIRSVDGIKDKEMILEWLAKLPPLIKDELSEEVERLNQWGVQFNYEVECPKCKHKNDVKTTLNPIGFFTLPSSRKTK